MNSPYFIPFIHSLLDGDCYPIHDILHYPPPNITLLKRRGIDWDGERNVQKRRARQGRPLRQGSCYALCPSGNRSPTHAACGLDGRPPSTSPPKLDLSIWCIYDQFGFGSTRSAFNQSILIGMMLSGGPCELLWTWSLGASTIEQASLYKLWLCSCSRCLISLGSCVMLESCHMHV